MPRVLCEGGYRDIDEVYMARTKSHQIEIDAGLPAEGWTLFDTEGRKCVCAFDRNTLFYWITNNEIKLLARN